MNVRMPPNTTQLPEARRVATERAAVCFDFVVLPGFTALAVSAALEPLQRANRTLDRKEFGWRILSVDGAPVRSEEGWQMPVDGAVDQRDSSDFTIVCGGNWENDGSSRIIASHLRRLWRAGKHVGGFCNGIHAMALAGILAGRQVAVHWQDAPRCQATWPKVDWHDKAFCIDGKIISCAAPLAAADLMLELIDLWHGRAVAQRVMDLCLIRHRRDRQDSQTMPVAPRIGSRNPKLLRAIEWIEKNFMQEDCVHGCASASGTSMRQLQRLFRRYLGLSPVQFLVKTRLEHGKSLLRSTDMPVGRIALDCGFSSSETFSRSFKREFGISPSQLLG